MRTLLILLPLFFLSSLNHHTGAATLLKSPNNGDLPLRELIKLSPGSYAKVTGQHLNLKQRISFRLLKSSMKKEVRKNQQVTLKEFLASKKKTDRGRSIVILLLIVILMGFTLFVVTFQD